MGLGSVIVRAVEAVVALAILALVVCSVKFAWINDLTEQITARWVETTDPMFEADWMDDPHNGGYATGGLEPYSGPYPVTAAPPEPSLTPRY